MADVSEMVGAALTDYTHGEYRSDVLVCEFANYDRIESDTVTFLGVPNTGQSTPPAVSVVVNSEPASDLVPDLYLNFGDAEGVEQTELPSPLDRRGYVISGHTMPSAQRNPELTETYGLAQPAGFERQLLPGEQAWLVITIGWAPYEAFDPITMRHRAALIARTFAEAS